MHTLRGVLYIPTTWVSICFVYCTGFLRPQRADKQRLDTPLSFCLNFGVHFKSVPIVPFNFLIYSNNVMEINLLHNPHNPILSL